MGTLFQGFAGAFYTTAMIVAKIAGVACAVAITGAVVLLLAALIGAAFNASTDAMARYWLKTGRTPRGKWARVLINHEKHGGKQDGANGNGEKEAGT